jgi:hypothetical protein
MCSERFKNIAKTRLLPVFKYVKGQNISVGGKLYTYIQEHNSMDKIIAKSQDIMHREYLRSHRTLPNWVM